MKTFLSDKQFVAHTTVAFEESNCKNTLKDKNALRSLFLALLYLKYENKSVGAIVFYHFK